jgi:general secretion pathway protein G
MKMQTKRNTGFTLVEILIALTILVLLAGGGIVAYQKVLVNANNKAAMVRIEGARGSIDLYVTAMGVAPGTEEGWDALITEPEEDAKKKNWYRIIDEKPVDAWGNVLKYEKNDDDDGFKVWSVGKDGDDGTDDDIKLDAEKDE